MNTSPADIVVSDEEAGDAVVDVVVEVVGEADVVVDVVGEEDVVVDGRPEVGDLRPAWWGPLPHAESAATTKMAGTTRTDRGRARRPIR